MEVLLCIHPIEHESSSNWVWQFRDNSSCTECDSILLSSRDLNSFETSFYMLNSLCENRRFDKWIQRYFERDFSTSNLYLRKTFYFRSIKKINQLPRLEENFNEAVFLVVIKFSKGLLSTQEWRAQWKETDWKFN